MAGLVLDLRKQYRLALQRRCARQPVTFRLHTNNFGMGVLRNLPHQSSPIRFGHPVLRFDFFLIIDATLERLQPGGIFDSVALGSSLPFLIKALRVHE